MSEKPTHSDGQDTRETDKEKGTRRTVGQGYRSAISSIEDSPTSQKTMRQVHDDTSSGIHFVGVYVHELHMAQIFTSCYTPSDHNLLPARLRSVTPTM